MTVTSETLRGAPSLTARATVLAAATLTIMAAAVIAPSLPAMAVAYADTPGADVLVRLALTITSLAIALSAPVAGHLADRFGRRPVLLTGLVLYAAAGTAAWYLADLWLLLFSRALLGVAVGAIMTSITALITDWFDGPARARLMGMQQSFASLGGVVFLPLAGVLAELDYRAPAGIYGLSLLLLPFAIAAVREPAKPTEPGTPSAATPVWRTSATVYFVYALAFTVTLVFFLAPTQLPFLLRDFGVGPTATGVVIAGSTLTGAFGALAFPRLRRRAGSSVITAASVALLAAGWLIIGAANATPMVVAGLLVGGIGVGLSVPNLNLMLSEIAPAERRGRILSGLVAAVFLGQFASPLLAQPLITATGIAGTFTLTGSLCATGVLIAVALSLRPRRGAVTQA